MSPTTCRDGRDDPEDRQGDPGSRPFREDGRPIGRRSHPRLGWPAGYTVIVGPVRRLRSDAIPFGDLGGWDEASSICGIPVRRPTMRIRVRVDQSGGRSKTLDVAGESIRLGRNEECEVAVDPVAFPMVSGVHARIEPTPRGFVLVHLSQNNKTLVNDSTVDGLASVRSGIGSGSGSPVRRSRSWRSSRPHPPGRRTHQGSGRPSRPTSGTWPCSAALPGPSGSTSAPAA
jgi:hypothetical protein